MAENQPTMGTRLADVLVAALLGVVAAVSVRSFAAYPSISADEGIYTGQAWAVVRGSLAPYTYVYDHPPLGWIELAPLLWLSEVVGWSDSAVMSARTGPALFLIVDAVLLQVLARRLGTGRVLAACAALAFLLSPLTRDYLPRVYLDNLALPWALGAFIVALDPRRPRRQQVLSAALMAVAVLVKESALLLYPALVLTVVCSTVPGRRRAAAVRNGLVLAAAGACYPLFAFLRGEPVAFAKALGWQLLAREGSGSILDPGSGRHATVLGWCERDPLLCAVGVAAAVFLLVGRWRHRYLGLTVLVPLLVAVKPGGYLPGMFVIIGIPFLALCPAVAVAEVCRRLRPQPSSGRAHDRPVVAAAACTALALTAAGYLAVGAVRPRDETAGEVSVARWVEANLPVDATVLVDDAVFAELYVHGRDDVWRQAVMAHILDHDPNVSTFVPGGWREIEYAVVTPKLRHAAEHAGAVQVRAALQHGEVIAALGPVTGSTEILRVR